MEQNINKAMQIAIKKCLQDFIDNDLKANGEVSQKTLDALAEQKYQYKNGKLSKERAVAVKEPVQSDSKVDEQPSEPPHSEDKANIEKPIESEKPAETSIKAAPEKPIELLVRTAPYEKEGTNIKGFATLTINNSVCIKSIKICEGKNGLYVQMPTYKDSDGKYSDMIFPITPESRKDMNAKILNEFENPTIKTVDKELIPIENNYKISMKLQENSAIKGIATVTINETYVIKRIAVVDGQNGLFMQMPGYKKADGKFESIALPCNTEIYQQLNTAVLNKYNEVFEKANVKTLDEWEKDIDAAKLEKAADSTEKAMEKQAEKIDSKEKTAINAPER